MTNFQRALKIICVALITVPACQSSADTIPPCPMPIGVEEHAFPQDIPPPLKLDLEKRIGQLALPGEQFDNTDAVITGQNRRLIFARSKGNRWVIATEHGSAIYNDPILAYDVAKDSSGTSFITEVTALPLTVCKIANRLLGSD